MMQMPALRSETLRGRCPQVVCAFHCWQPRAMAEEEFCSSTFGSNVFSFTCRVLSPKSSDIL